MVKKRYYNIVFILLAATYVFVVNNKPRYNWDLLPYMAIVKGYSEPDFHKVHEEVYSEVKASTGPYTFKMLADHLPYREECYKDPEIFKENIDFYKTKPLYTGLIFVLHKMGFSIFRVIHVPSLVAGFFLLLIMYAWLCSYVHPAMAIILTAGCTLLKNLSDVQNSVTPDAMSAVFILFSLFIMATGKNSKWLLPSLLLAVLTRIDNFIFSGIAYYYSVVKAARKRLVVSLIIVMLVIGSVFIIPYLAGAQIGWFKKFLFLKSHVQYYWHCMDVLRALKEPRYILFILAGLYLLFFSDKKIRPVINTIVLSVIIHMILFPSLQERFFIAHELGIIILIIRYVSTYLTTGKVLLKRNSD